MRVVVGAARGADRDRPAARCDAGAVRRRLGRPRRARSRATSTWTPRDARRSASAPAWKALERHFAEVGRRPPARPLRAAIRSRGERLARRGRGPLPRLLEEPDHRRDAAAARRARRGVRACPSGSRRCSAASTSTSPRTAPSSTSRCGCRASASLVVDGRDVVADVHEVLDRMSALLRAGPLRRVDGATPGKPIRNVVNIGIGGSDLGPVMAYRALRAYSDREPHVPLRLERRRHRLRRGDARPRPRGDALRRRVEDVHDARDDDERAHGPRLAAGARSATTAAVAKHFVAVSTNAEEVAALRHRHREHVRASGTGSAAATRWTRRSGSRR